MACDPEILFAFSERRQKRGFWHGWRLQEELEVLPWTTSRSGKFWDDYQEAYEEMVQNTATKRRPWYVVLADNNGMDVWWWLRQSSSAGRIELGVPDVDKEKKKD